MSIVDNITRLILDGKSNYRVAKDITIEGDEFQVPSNYKVVYYDDFKGNLDTNWHKTIDLNQPYHPNQLWQWYDASLVQQNRNGVTLDEKFKPKKFVGVKNPIDWAIGTMMSKQTYMYGIYKFTLKLPYGKYLWPAIWLSGSKNWPPEIDILEAYSGEDCIYDTDSRLTTNIHYSRNGKHKQVGAMKHPLPNKVTEEYLNFILHWEKGFIKIYYNGYKVYQCTDSIILNKINEPMHIIMNNGRENVNDHRGSVTPLTISSVVIYQK
jgi:beta-glucanase (GH16 family)